MAPPPKRARRLATPTETPPEPATSPQSARIRVSVLVEPELWTALHEETRRRCGGGRREVMVDVIIAILIEILDKHCPRGDVPQPFPFRFVYVPENGVMKSFQVPTSAWADMRWWATLLKSNMKDLFASIMWEGLKNSKR